MFWPFIPVLVAGVIAAICGCELDGVQPCIVFGRDIGKALHGIGFIGYFGMATFPTGVIALIAFAAFVWWRTRTATRDRG
jgi:hypothetical protein